MENVLEWVRLNVFAFLAIVVLLIIIWITISQIIHKMKTNVEKSKIFDETVVSNKNFNNLAPEINIVPNYEEQPESIVDNDPDWNKSYRDFNDAQENNDFEN